MLSFFFFLFWLFFHYKLIIVCSLYAHTSPTHTQGTLVALREKLSQGRLFSVVFNQVTAREAENGLRAVHKLQGLNLL
jgi:hypothetical protein